MSSSTKRRANGQRRVEVPFTVLPSQQGFQVFRINVPGSLREVTGTPDNPDCNCPEFIWRPNPENRCAHTQAVFRYLHEHPDVEDEWCDRVEATSNRPIASVGESDESVAPAAVYLVRQVSRDGSVDTLSIHFSLDTDGLPAQDIGSAIQKLTAQQEDIIEEFRGNVAGRRRLALALRASDGQHSDVAKQPIRATLRNVGGVVTTKGRRFFLNADVDGSIHKLFGTMDELEEHLAAAGFSYPEPNLAEGMVFDVPCRVVLTPSECGRYLNVEKLLGMAETSVS